MGDIEKRLNKSAIKKAAAWGTEINVGVASAGIMPLNAGAPKFNMKAIDDESASSPFDADLDFANIDPSDFSLDFDYRYEGLENMLLAMLMGTAGAPVVQGATAAYKSTFQLASSVFGIFGTYATEKAAKIHIVPSFKVMKYTLSMNNGLIKASFGLRGDQVIDTSSVITSMSSVTIPDKHNKARYYQGVWRMNAQSGAALAAPTDVIKPKNFVIEIERKFDSEHENGRTICEPRETGKPTVKVTMDFPRMDTTNSAYFADRLAETEKKLDFVLTGAQIASPYNYSKTFLFPRLKIEDIEYPEGAVIPAKIVLRGLEADSAPTGMTAITKPVQVEVINKRTTDYLA